jgi:hypothetical protein
VLRYLKIITPVECVIPLYDGRIMPPKDGELHRSLPVESTVELDRLVWSVNVDNPGCPATRSFRLLWDATDILLSK